VTWRVGTRLRLHQCLLKTTKVALCLILSSATCELAAQGEHAQRVAAEISVIVGDIQRLDTPDISEQHRKGLMHRVIGGVSALDILLRLADQEMGNPVEHHLRDVRHLRNYITKGDFTSATKVLSQWQSKYALHVEKFTQINVEQNTIGKNLHHELCAHCHDRPMQNTERPAYNLFSEVKRLTPEEFLARLLIGVRGDRVTGIDNPLTDYEIAALFRYYQVNGTDQHQAHRPDDV